MIAAREVAREYLALVEGWPALAHGHDRRADRPRPPRPDASWSAAAAPREAATHFEVGERLPRDALVDARLETGRTHQIRAHLPRSAIPVGGDPLYGSAGRHGLERQFLHTRRLAFEHPVTGERLEFELRAAGGSGEALGRARG